DQPRGAGNTVTFTGWVYGAFVRRVLTRIKLNQDSWFIPLGWSREGHFAYMIHYAGMACDYMTDFFIKDKNNKVIYQKQTPCGPGVEELWLSAQYEEMKEFRAKLKRYKVIFMVNHRLTGFPLRVGNESYQLVTKKKVRAGEFSDYLSGLSVYLKSANKMKLVYGKDFPAGKPRISVTKGDKKYLKALGKTRGYIKSPWNNRIAIIQTGYYLDFNHAGPGMLVFGVSLAGL
ncbi:MAG: hypothetical protein OEZ36_04435, partial [Spirochaetota bacterium]|nr:hypothetical protein [Spirochaetota bacterium]